MENRKPLMDVNKHLARTLRIIRKSHKLTQDQLAQRAGLDRTSVAHIESGRQKTSIEQLYALSFALGLTDITVLLPSMDEAQTSDFQDARDTLEELAICVSAIDCAPGSALTEAQNIAARVLGMTVPELRAQHMLQVLEPTP